jgi:transcriptional regulator with XRE-family HTH domain
MNIGEKIQTLRKQNEISQEQLAEKLNITRQAVSKWETGESLPDIENIVQLSNIFNVTADELLRNQPAEKVEVVDETPFNENLFIAQELEQERRKGMFNFSLERDMGYTVSFGSISVVVFFVLGFVWGLWHPGWVVFILAWVIDDFIDYLRRGKINFSFYGIALIAVVLVRYFVEDARFAWLFFIAAWALTNFIRPIRRKRKRKPPNFVN